MGGCAALQTTQPGPRSAYCLLNRCLGLSSSGWLCRPLKSAFKRHWHPGRACMCMPDGPIASPPQEACSYSEVTQAWLASA